MQQISYKQVSLMNGSFWYERYMRNIQVTAPSVWDRFYETNRIYAVLKQFPAGADTTTHKFWDSDVAKWMEGVAYLVARPDLDGERRRDFTEKVTLLIEALKKNQLPDGYINCHYNADTRFRDRDGHELYCAGHYIEAAVAWYDATGSREFLDIMCRYADLIDRIFRVEQSAPFVTDGHEEIEPALMRLYRATGEKRYLRLCGHFLNMRGSNAADKPVSSSFSANYSQDYAPVRQQTAAAGHAVRANYLYTAMADYAAESGDKEMAEACRALWQDITERKMYITGGCGSAREGESFTIPYDLPNETAYSETCAAIALVMFGEKMWKASPKAEYQDVIERALFNNVLSGVSLSGDRFFYINPLRLDKHLRDRYTALADNFPKRPLRQRPAVFRCSCCPPNVVRLLARIGDFAYGKQDNTYYVNQFIASEMTDGQTGIRLTTGYPYGKSLYFELRNVEILKVRLPGWLVNRDALYKNTLPAEGKKFSANADFTVDENGYLTFVNPPENLTVTFDGMKPALVYADPRVTENAGKCAVAVGPVVYCAEECDNPEVLSCVLKPESIANPMVSYDAQLDADTLTLETTVGHAPFPEEQRYLKMIPYFAFANREESDMTVWLPVK